MQTKESTHQPYPTAYPPTLPFQLPPKLLPDSSWDQLITITEVRLKSSTLFAVEPVTLKSLKNTDSGYIFVLNQELGINVSAKSYKQLVLDVHEYIDFLSNRAENLVVQGEDEWNGQRSCPRCFYPVNTRTAV